MSKADEVLRSIEKMTEKKFLPIVGPDKGQVLVEIIRRNKPMKVLEIGTLVGYSAILMARELDRKAHLTTIGICEEESEIARKNIRRAEVPPTVHVIVGDAIDVISKLDGKFDLVFIDAEKTEYLEYLRLVESKTHRGSIIVADNVGILADEMRDYLTYVRSSKKYSSNCVRVDGDALEVSVRL